jgi:lysophospholipase L1-like esterase
MKYLALGDSYTIGEQVAEQDNFPQQFVRLAQSKGIAMELDKLIAVTGWTTDELATAIYQNQPELNYDFVTLLIGVNNQYRGRTAEEFAWQFYSLLCQSVLFAGAKPEQVVVLSIPDWGQTPFNTERDAVAVSNDIDAFNSIKKQITVSMGCHFIDITASTRIHAKDPFYLAPDLLHYSANEYALWAEKIMDLISAQHT